MMITFGKHCCVFLVHNPNLPLFHGQVFDLVIQSVLRSLESSSVEVIQATFIMSPRSFIIQECFRLFKPCLDVNQPWQLRRGLLNIFSTLFTWKNPNHPKIPGVANSKLTESSSAFPSKARSILTESDKDTEVHF